MRNGYPVVHVADHPRADKDGYVLEHTLIAERALGRPLAERHPVHHFDENRENNSHGNLVICEDDGYHKLLHRRQRAFAACGNPSWRKCKHCKQYDAPENLSIFNYPYQGGSTVYHQSCEAVFKQHKRGQ